MNEVSNDPIQNLNTALQDDILCLQGMGISQPTDLMALQFAMQQAGGLDRLRSAAVKVL